MLRVQPGPDLDELERETLGNFTRDGLRETRFVKSDAGDRERAAAQGWGATMLDFAVLGEKGAFEAVLDSLAGFTRCSEACAYFCKIAVRQGVVFHFGPETGASDGLLEEEGPESSRKKAVGVKTKDGLSHAADVVVIAGKVLYEDSLYVPFP